MTTDREASKSGNVLSQGSGGQKSWSLFGASERTPAPTSECSLLVRASSPCFQTNDCRLGTCSLPLVKSGAPPCRDGRNGSPLRGPGEALHITDVSGVGVSYRAVQRSRQHQRPLQRVPLPHPLAAAQDAAASVQQGVPVPAGRPEMGERPRLRAGQ